MIEKGKLFLMNRSTLSEFNKKKTHLIDLMLVTGKNVAERIATYNAKKDTITIYQFIEDYFWDFNHFRIMAIENWKRHNTAETIIQSIGTGNE